MSTGYCSHPLNINASGCQAYKIPNFGGEFGVPHVPQLVGYNLTITLGNVFANLPLLNSRISLSGDDDEGFLNYNSILASTEDGRRGRVG